MSESTVIPQLENNKADTFITKTIKVNVIENLLCFFPSLCFHTHIHFPFLLVPKKMVKTLSLANLIQVKTFFNHIFFLHFFTPAPLGILSIAKSFYRFLLSWCKVLFDTHIMFIHTMLNVKGGPLSAFT